jgi:Predicted phosphohydrolases
MDYKQLSQLTNEQVMALFSPEEKEALATQHWSFDVNLPVIVSVMVSEKLKIEPFWLKEKGFQKTSLTMKNEQTVYDVWQKSFKAGRVGLGVNGFDQDLGMHYFVSVAPERKGDQLNLSNFFPEKQFVGVLDNGAFTYHDWDELVLTDVPAEMIGQKLLTTTRGRTAASHLIGAFRSTSHPSSSTPDQVHLSWSSDPATSMDIQWRTDTTVNISAVKFRIKGTNEEQSVSAEKIRLEDRMLANDRYVNNFTAKLSKLKPGTTYEYVVGNKADWKEASSFNTAGDDHTYSFLWFGDTHYSPKFGEILHLSYEEHPDVAFYSIVGDLVSDGLFRNQWDDLFEYSLGVMDNIPLMAVPGNHDNRAGLGAQLFRDQFSYPFNAPEGVPTEQTYSFTYKNTLFLMVDATSPMEPQTPWIEKQLAESKATWKIVMFHFPPYNWEEPYFDIQKAWVPLFDKYHVDMVCGGHIHYYMRSKPMRAGVVVPKYCDGTVYAISIATSTHDHEMTPEPYAAVRSALGPLYQYVKVDGSKLIYQAFDLQNKMIDSFEIKK